MFFVQSCSVCNAETEDGVFCHACRRSELLLEAMPGMLNLDGAVMGYKYSGALAVKGVWQPQVLARIKATAPQYGLAPDKRRSNVRGCFAVQGDVRGAKILLVDDILTTGATLDEAAKTLKQAGAKSVYALTLCGSLENFKD